MQGDSGQITQLLAASRRGDQAAHTRLWEAVYDEIRAIARHQMANEEPSRTLQPTALANEAYLRLFGDHPVDFKNRCHFFAAAARAMRQIRVDNARARRRLKRGGSQRRRSLDDSELPDGGLCLDEDPSVLLDLEAALSRLSELDVRMAEIVELRYFGGFTREQIGGAIGVAPRTVDQLWSRGRAWLARALADNE